MANSYSNIFSNEYIEYLNQLPEVIAAKAKLNSSSSFSKVYFSIQITDTIRDTLHARLGLDLSHVSEIPMRWIKGDTSPHIDSGSKSFENTYLVYLNDSPGEFILNTTEYPITANTAYVFNEGLMHKTQNTGITPRLLLGPMNEFIEPVGSSVYYYSNYADAIANNNSIASGNSTIIGNLDNGSIGSYTSWRIAYIITNSFGGGATIYPTGVYSNGDNLNTLFPNGYSFFLYPAAPCFLEGSKILCQVDGVDVYLPIETIKTGTLVKTNLDGYKKVELIGKGDIKNPGNDERTENRLYKCTPKNYPELKEDLYITGCHSILVDRLTDLQRELTIKHVTRIFVTSNKYRLVAYIDERAEPWNSEGIYTIWHLALENNNEKMNYGIYANGGLLVESCNLYFLKNQTNMKCV